MHLLSIFRKKKNKGNRKIPVGLYPIAIIQSRYGGAYEGGEWHAIADYEEFLDIGNDAPDYVIAYQEYATGDDCAAFDFWQLDYVRMHIGVGDTPDDALASLIKRRKWQLTPTSPDLEMSNLFSSSTTSLDQLR